MTRQPKVPQTSPLMGSGGLGAIDEASDGDDAMDEGDDDVTTGWNTSSGSGAGSLPPLFGSGSRRSANMGASTGTSTGAGRSGTTKPFVIGGEPEVCARVCVSVSLSRCQLTAPFLRPAVPACACATLSASAGRHLAPAATGRPYGH